MDVMEKLVELINEATPKPYCSVPDMNCNICKYNHPKWHCVDIRVADHLIANGVTVQQWIPVTERLPEKGVLVLCIGLRGGMFIGNPSLVYDNEDTAYTYVPNSRRGRNTKYWMPLPTPPKEE